MSQFTIIIPTYKRPFLLKKAIKSALAQTVRDIHVLVLDNASNDETELVVQNFCKIDSRLIYIAHKENIGLIGQYKYGIDHVKTDFFSFLSDDDILLPQFCEVSLKEFEKYPQSSFVASSTLIITKKGNVVREPLREWQREGLYDSSEGPSEMVGKYPVPTTIAFRRSKVKSEWINETNPLQWDCDFLLKVASEGSFSILKEITGLFLHHEGSFSSNPSPIRIVEALELILSRHKSKLSRDASLIIENEILMKALVARDYDRFKKYLALISQKLGYHSKLKILNFLAEFGRYFPFLISFSRVLYRGFRRKKKVHIHEICKDFPSGSFPNYVRELSR